MRRAVVPVLILGLRRSATAPQPRPINRSRRGGYAVLDRVAFAVDGVESTHGTDPKMWRSEPDGPQGPMQVSAAAAADVGGGNRFDEQENRALGRAYLAQMYRRYGSWPDAVAAYNWGPGHVDSWIGGGRPFDKLPLAVERYRIRVLVGRLAPPVSIGSRGGRRPIPTMAAPRSRGSTARSCRPATSPYAERLSATL